MIVFYDIPSLVPGKAWSPNTWKIRLILNYKGIPYRTEWIEYPEIEPHSKRLGIKPTGKKPDGSPLYSLPAIYDPPTGTYLADSFVIAEYLEKTYPETPIFPKLGTLSKEYYRRAREVSAFGKTLEEMVPVGSERIVQWAKFREGMNKVDESWAKTDAKGPFAMGDTISWADFFLSGYLIYMKVVWGEESEEWKDVASWNEGRWENILHILGEYQTIK